MAIRFDSGTLRSPVKMPDGRWRLDARATRSGVFKYVGSDGKIRREYRPPSEVFGERSMESMKMIVVTDDHPVDAATKRHVLLDESNVEKYMVGVGGEESVRRDDNHLVTSIYVPDSYYQRMKALGKYDCSLGYKLDTIEKPGVTPEGEHYDAVQVNLVNNHLAIVTRGRAGSTQIRVDSDVLLQLQEERQEVMDPEKLAQAHNDALTKIADLENQLAQEKTRADSAEGKAATLEIEVKSLKEQRTDSDQIAELEVKLSKALVRADTAEKKLVAVPETIAKLVASRVAIERSATQVLGDKDKDGKPLRFDGLTDRQVMDMVIGKLQSANTDGKSDDYVRARFDMAVESHLAGSAAMNEITLRTQIAQRKEVNAASGKGQSRTDADDVPIWRRPLPSSLAAKG